MTWPWLVLSILFGVGGIISPAVWVARHADEATRDLVKRAVRLSFRSKLRLAWRLGRDRHIPLPLRAVPFVAVLYVATPIDLIPDFIPVLGQLDDLLVIVLAAGLLARFTPSGILEEHIVYLEAKPTAKSH